MILSLRPHLEYRSRVGLYRYILHLRSRTLRPQSPLRSHWTIITSTLEGDRDSPLSPAAFSVVLNIEDSTYVVSPYSAFSLGLITQPLLLITSVNLPGPRLCSRPRNPPKLPLFLPVEPITKSSLMLQENEA